MATPKGKDPIDLLLEELATVRAELHEQTAGDNLKAADSVAHCGLMIRVWSLRFQIADIQNSASGMALASREAAEWEKRKSAAKRDIKADILERELEHNAEQEALAGDLAGLH